MITTNLDELIAECDKVIADTTGQLPEEARENIPVP